ncbi:MAG: tRNA pseudouridine(38-40) synthase TruA [Chloroflexi bacterium]|nr:tRNA pseudouridine(38-40) synthase TruA [Chloroflexota bacterium]HEV8054643.1 tRNA pseudouridine(38-40) synthase TruA [Candidatus Limnocylindrales bacterium]
MRYCARVEYDGTDFRGFQSQPNGRSVQSELETALRQLAGGGRIRVDAAGRTDSGVHAQGQVIAFSFPRGRSVASLARSLDALLPRDIAVSGLERAASDFSPRREARSREYRYSIWNGPRSPLRERYALGVREPLDITAMTETARILVGRHDFSAFGGGHLQPVRTVRSITVRKHGRLVTIDVLGDAFLRQMVRSIVAALLRVGHGQAGTEEVALALASKGRAFAGAVAPPEGLSLRRVELTTTKE